MKPYDSPIKPADWNSPMVAVIGMGAGPEDFQKVLDWIGRAEVLAGGARHIGYFSHHPGEKIVFGVPLSLQIDLVEEISKSRRTAVLASGDPLFFGIGKRLVEKFGRDRLIMVPNVTSVQVLCSRIREPWHNIETVSLHGREGTAEAAMSHIVGRLSAGVKVTVMTDPVHSPRWIANRLAESGHGECTMVVGEDIGNTNERIREFHPLEAVNEDFSDLNLVLVRPAEVAYPELRREQVISPSTSKDGSEVDGSTPAVAGPGRIFGFPESYFEREAGLITKMEVRAVALALLRLSRGQVLWDVGAGSGSVAIEAARLAPLTRAFAVEKDEGRYLRMVENIRNFEASSVTAVHGEAPGVFTDFPDPDRVFIGGSGNALPQILETVARRLAPGGGVVQTIVVLETLEKVKNFWTSRDFGISVTQIQVSRSTPLGKDMRLEALNPVFILSAWR